MADQGRCVKMLSMMKIDRIASNNDALVVVTGDCRAKAACP